MTPKRLSARQRNDKAVADMVDTVMRDTRWDRLRTRRARLTIVAAMVTLLVAVPVAWITLPSIAALGVLLVATGVWWALRMSVRVIADLPEDYLDERQARMRDRAYVDAYRWFAGVTLLGATVGLFWFVAVSSNDVATVEVSWGEVMAIFWALEGLALTLPSIVLALREPDRT
jgi:hypothetical protein